LSPTVFEQFWLVLIVCGHVAVAHPGALPNRYLQAQEVVSSEPTNAFVGQ
jgi:hypothetical protein